MFKPVRQHVAMYNSKLRPTAMYAIVSRQRTCEEYRLIVYFTLVIFFRRQYF